LHFRRAHVLAGVACFPPTNATAPARRTTSGKACGVRVEHITLKGVKIGYLLTLEGGVARRAEDQRPFGRVGMLAAGEESIGHAAGNARQDPLLGSHSYRCTVGFGKNCTKRTEAAAGCAFSKM
jgi:hypothetical protein